MHRADEERDRERQEHSNNEVPFLYARSDRLVNPLRTVEIIKIVSGTKITRRADKSIEKSVTERYGEYETFSPRSKIKSNYAYLYRSKFDFAYIILILFFYLRIYNLYQLWNNFALFYNIIYYVLHEFI